MKYADDVWVAFVTAIENASSEAVDWADFEQRVRSIVESSTLPRDETLPLATSFSLACSVSWDEPRACVEPLLESVLTHELESLTPFRIGIELSEWMSRTGYGEGPVRDFVMSLPQRLDSLPERERREARHCLLAVHRNGLERKQ